jgi:hypothetical protein
MTGHQILSLLLRADPGDPGRIIWIVANRPLFPTNKIRRGQCDRGCVDKSANRKSYFRQRSAAWGAHMLKSISGGNDCPPVTDAQFAAIEFRAVKGIAALSEAKRKQHFRALARQVCEMAWICGEMIALDKEKAVEIVRKDYELFSETLLALGDARGRAEELLQILRSAEARLAVCLAVAENGPAAA